MEYINGTALVLVMLLAWSVYKALISEPTNTEREEV